jgi:hypothetical protein
MTKYAAVPVGGHRVRVVDVDDRGVSDGGQGPHLREETPVALAPAADHVRPDGLHRHPPLQTLVVGTVDVPHPALTDQCEVGEIPPGLQLSRQLGDVRVTGPVTAVTHLSSSSELQVKSRDETESPSPSTTRTPDPLISTRDPLLSRDRVTQRPDPSALHVDVVLGGAVVVVPAVVQVAPLPDAADHRVVLAVGAGEHPPVGRIARRRADPAPPPDWSGRTGYRTAPDAPDVAPDRSDGDGDGEGDGEGEGDRGDDCGVSRTAWTPARRTSCPRARR